MPFLSRCSIFCRILCGCNLPSLAVFTQSVLAVCTQLQPSMILLYVYAPFTVVYGFPIVQQQCLVDDSELDPGKVMFCLPERKSFMSEHCNIV